MSSPLVPCLRPLWPPLWTTCLLLSLTTAGANAQQDVTLLSRLDTKAAYGGVWGWTSLDYREFAIVGERTGTWIVETTDPRSPVERGYFPAPSSTWREITSHGDILYSVSEAHGGIRMIDMSIPDLPQDLGYRFETVWTNSHTIAVDPGAGRIYVNGTTGGLGGMHVLDVGTDPRNPTLIGRYTADYVHDIYPRRGIGYLSLINRGRIRIVDTTDPANLRQLGEFATPGQVTHNAWATDDDRLLLITDENPTGYLSAFDVSNPRLPRLLSDFRSPNGAIVHLVLGIGRTAFVAYYSDGYYCLDFADPTAPQLIGHYDTSPQFVGPGFNGAWGVYPWTDDGTIYISDVQNGLFCLQQDVGHLHRYGQPTAAASGVPRLTTEGAAIRVGASGLRFEVTGLEPSAPYLLFLSGARADFPLLGIQVHVDLQAALQVNGTADAQGRASIPFPIPPNNFYSRKQFFMQLVSVSGTQLTSSRGMWFGVAPR